MNNLWQSQLPAVPGLYNNAGLQMLPNAYATFPSSLDKPGIPLGNFVQVGPMTSASDIPQEPVPHRKRKMDSWERYGPENDPSLGLPTSFRGRKLYASETAMAAKLSRMSLGVGSSGESSPSFHVEQEPLPFHSIGDNPAAKNGYVSLPAEQEYEDSDFEDPNDSDDENSDVDIVQKDDQPRLELSDVLKDHFGRKTSILPKEVLENLLEPKPCMELVLWHPREEPLQAVLRSSLKNKRQTLRALRMSAESSSTVNPSFSFAPAPNWCIKPILQSVSPLSSTEQVNLNIPSSSNYIDDEAMMDTLSE